METRPESSPEPSSESFPGSAASVRCIGIMSGTSLDGIDVAVVDIAGSGPGASIDLVHATTTPFSPDLAENLSDLLDIATRTGSADLGRIARLQIRLAHEYARAVRSTLEELDAAVAQDEPGDAARGLEDAGGPVRTDVPVPTVVGCHGQTVFHAPEPEQTAGIAVRGTLQLGDPSALAVLLGITVVGDFRVADIALGGEGAPIVPYLDWCVLGSDDEPRLALNIGGIANVTILPAGADRDAVSAFDTGPGNCLIDAVCRQLLDQPFDRGGEIAASGSMDDSLLAAWMDEPYFRRPPPKSTGREYFDAGYADDLAAEARRAGLSAADTLATVTELTAASVADAIDRFAGRDRSFRRLIGSGGGVHNRTLMAGLKRRLPDISVESSADHGLDPDAKEAILCAFLAHEALAGVPAGMPSVTGASRPAVLGKICQGGQSTPSPR